MSQYIFDNVATQAAQRFGSLEALYDQRTLRFLGTQQESKLVGDA